MPPSAPPYPTPSPSIGSPAPADPNATFDRSSLALARSQRIIQSWLPSPDIQEDIAGSQKTQSGDWEPVAEEADILTVDPELAGVGAKLTDAQQAQNERAIADDRLKRQILGRDWKKKKEASKESSTGGVSGGKAGPNSKSWVDGRKADSGDEDEEGGRTSLGAKRISEGKPEGSGRWSEEHDQGSAVKKKRGTYLDEVLSARGYKKRKQSNFS